jgi:CheY-like chemotaxis protein
VFLIIEDNIVNQRVLKKQLVSCGWTVYVAGNGQEALDWLKRSKCWRGEQQADGRDELADHSLPPQSEAELDIILLDIEMPVMDGLTCARRIREYEDQGLLGSSSSTSASQRAATTNLAGPLISGDFSEMPEMQKSRLPILAVSANARMEQIQQAVAAGMDDAITKPFRISELWPKMQALIPTLSREQE